jgi:DNA-binding PadR family transcriptional regulator
MSIKLKVHKADEPEGVFEVVEVSPLELKILKALGNETLCGYQIVKRSNDGIRLGGVYTVLNHLKKKKLVNQVRSEPASHDNGLKKIFYTRTFDSEEVYHGKLRPE